MTPVDTIRTIYRELFTIRFLHKSYENPQENFLNKGLTLSPDGETKDLFKKYRMDYRCFNNRLTCYVQSSLFAPPDAEPLVPFVEMEGDIRIRFLMSNSSDFFDKTYIVAAGVNKTYEFSNRVSNINGGTVFLNAPLENYSAAKDYDAGTIVQDGGILYNTKQAVPAAGGIVLTDPAYWQSVTPFEPVVNNADLKDAATVDAEEKCLAVIDIYNNGTVDNSYNLFGVSEQLLDPAPVFTIQFMNRPIL